VPASAFPPVAPGLSTRLVVMENVGASIALVADEVVEVVSVSRSAVTRIDRPGQKSSAVAAMTWAGDRLILLLDVERLCEESIDLRLPVESEDARGPST
jgi:chemotaxis signal transduction protein